ncbi:extracellular serine/threonine protein kinase FAM20C-like [Physella acuta]|uniref:extracellular serine/threonine protein kinase FAM20C-like n=1 Tax=Physella acuta TaxID=109671 RepID=UPI0027DD2DAA|nr:extracellular serine/threonine protein kinase FAM20C-like [Physella acuta]
MYLIGLFASASWERFQRGIRQHYLYDPEEDDIVADLLRDLNTRPIVHTACNKLSSHLLLTLTFDDGGRAMFKPVKTTKYQETLPDHFYFSDRERPMAEIAAFHLDRVLAFYRAPPTVGRVLNITRDVVQVGDSELRSSAYTSPAGNTCVLGTCLVECTYEHGLCGTPDLIQGAATAMLPNRSATFLGTVIRNPWARSYDPRLKAEWEKDDDFCRTRVMSRSRFRGRTLLDLMDMAVFDFLIGNPDRHHYEIFRQFGLDTFVVLYDHGRGFGKPRVDDLSILAPVRQCCKIRGVQSYVAARGETKGRCPP